MPAGNSGPLASCVRPNCIFARISTWPQANKQHTVPNIRIRAAPGLGDLVSSGLRLLPVRFLAPFSFTPLRVASAPWSQWTWCSTASRKRDRFRSTRMMRRFCRKSAALYSAWPPRLPHSRHTAQAHHQARSTVRPHVRLCATYPKHPSANAGSLHAASNAGCIAPRPRTTLQATRCCSATRPWWRLLESATRTCYVRSPRSPRMRRSHSSATPPPRRWRRPPDASWAAPSSPQSPLP